MQMNKLLSDNPYDNYRNKLIKLCFFAVYSYIHCLFEQTWNSSFYQTVYRRALYALHPTLVISSIWINVCCLYRAQNFVLTTVSSVHSHQATAPVKLLIHNHKPLSLFRPKEIKKIIHVSISIILNIFLLSEF